MSENPQPGATGAPPFYRRTIASLVLYRSYRLLWLGSTTEHLGEWMETVALLWLVNEMTHSPLMLTLVGAFRHLPLIVFSFIGGVTADRVNRRNLLIYTLLASAALSLALAFLVHTGLVAIWHIIVIALLGGVVTSFNHPARQTLVPNMVKREHLLNAITLDSGSVTASRIIGAPLAGFIIASAGTTPVFGLRAVGALVAIVWLFFIKAPPTPPEARKRAPLRSLVEGLGYVKRHRNVLTQVLLYLLPYFVTNSYTSLLPVFATDVLHVGPAQYGLMHAAPGLGALLATLSLASVGDFGRKGVIQLSSGVFQGLMLLSFAFSPWLLLSLPLLMLIGAMNTMFMTLNTTIVQEMITDQVRGRVMALREVSFGLGPSASILSGSVAEVVGAPLAVGLAGLIALLVPLGLLSLVPRFRQG